MSETFTLPPGCRGFTTADGQTLRADSKGTITLEDHHAARLMRSKHAAVGLVSRRSYQLGTREGRWCTACRRLWQGWSMRCPKCNAATIAESEMRAAS